MNEADMDELRDILERECDLDFASAKRVAYALEDFIRFVNGDYEDGYADGKAFGYDEGYDQGLEDGEWADE